MLLQAVARTDTVLVQQVGSVHGWYEVLSAASNALMTVALIVLTVFLVGVALEVRRISHETHAMITRISGDATPLIQQVAVIVTNMYHMTNSLKTHLETVGAAIDKAEHSLKTAVAQTEERLNEFNALLTVVQEEAESMFVATASTVRGVRAGAAALHHDDESIVDDVDDDLSEELNDDGNDSPDPEERTPGPRVRARRG